MISESAKEFEKLFHLFYSPLCNYAMKITGDSDSAEDIVQNLFIQLWENNRLNDVVNTEHFLLKAVKFKCIDYLRTKKADLFISLDNIEDSAFISTNDLKDEDIEPLFCYFAAKLPPKTREVFLLSRKSGMTYKEIAEELGISVKTVENQMGRALRILKELLKDQKLLLWIILSRIFDN